MSVEAVVLWLFVIVLGVAFGAGLYEHRILLPHWFKPAGPVDSEAMRRTDSGRGFWAFVTTGPLTLLTLASLVLAYRAEGALRDWWLATAALVLLERVGTFAYFIPTAVKLMRGDEGASPRAARWTRLNRIRIALNLAGWLVALKAFLLLGAQR